MLMSTDVTSIMLPVSRAIMDRDRELQDTMAGVHPNSTGASGAAVRGMKRGDPASDAQTSAALVESAGAECKRPRIDGSGVVAEVGQVRRNRERSGHLNCSVFRINTPTGMLYSQNTKQSAVIDSFDPKLVFSCQIGC